MSPVEAPKPAKIHTHKAGVVMPTKEYWQDVNIMYSMFMNRISTKPPRREIVAKIIKRRKEKERCRLINQALFVPYGHPDAAIKAD